MLIEGSRCFNDFHKHNLKTQIKDILATDTANKLPAAAAEELSTKIYESTRLRDLLEFSRSIHAEMDAIVSIARKGSQSTKGTYMYSTTFPCHNCARHIIAAGIKKMFYIQPYEKSLASDLHGDDLVLDPTETDDKTDRVQFLHFEGTAPRQYLNFFQSKSERKGADGRAVSTVVSMAAKVTPQYLDNYMDLEAKVAKHLKELGIESAELGG